MKRTILISSVVFTYGLALAAPESSFDWPQWQGAERNAMSKETGLLKEWPEAGPALDWKIDNLGGGYGGPAVSSGRIYGMSKRDGKEVVWALSEKDGSEIWAQEIGIPQEGGMRQGIEGTGCTPTVDGEILYVIGHGGDLVCLTSADGSLVWRKNLISDFGGRLPTWRFNESPLVDGNKLICTPGGTESTLVALDKRSGDLIWSTKIPDSATEESPPTARRTPRGNAHAEADRDAPNDENSDEKKHEEEATPKFDPVVVVAGGSKWKFLDDGSDPGSHWMERAFDDSNWQAGDAQLGYGDRDEKTRLNASPDNYPSYYFRREFDVEDPAKLKPLVLRLLRDDGAIVYLNGKEVVRDNMPDGPISHETFAESTTPSENGFFVHEMAAANLVSGTNILAVAVHQADVNSSDLSFDLELREMIPGSDKIGPPPPDRRRGGGGFGGRRFGESGAGYSSAIAIDFGGTRQYVQFTSKTVAGVSAEDGKLLWRYDNPSNRGGINCSTPIFHNGQIFAASAYGAGGGLAKLSKESDGSFKAEETWFSRDMENHHGGMLIIDDCIYGSNGGNGGGYLICLDLKNGDVLWNERDRDKRRAKKGSIAFADGRIYYRTEEGTVLLIEPNRDQYIERGRFDQPDRTRQPAWTHPIIANGKLYIRDQETLYRYNIKDSDS